MHPRLDLSSAFPNMVFSSSSSTSQASCSDVPERSDIGEDAEYDDCSRLLIPATPSSSLPEYMRNGVYLRSFEVSSTLMSMCHCRLMTSAQSQNTARRTTLSPRCITDKDNAYTIEFGVCKEGRSTVYAAKVAALEPLNASVNSLDSVAFLPRSGVPEYVSVKAYHEHDAGFSRSDLANEIMILQRVRKQCPFLSEIFASFEGEGDQQGNFYIVMVSI